MAVVVGANGLTGLPVPSKENPNAGQHQYGDVSTDKPQTANDELCLNGLAKLIPIVGSYLAKLALRSTDWLSQDRPFRTIDHGEVPTLPKGVRKSRPPRCNFGWKVTPGHTDQQMQNLNSACPPSPFGVGNSPVTVSDKSNNNSAIFFHCPWFRPASSSIGASSGGYVPSSPTFTYLVATLKVSFYGQGNLLDCRCVTVAVSLARVPFLNSSTTNMVSAQRDPIEDNGSRLHRRGSVANNGHALQGNWAENAEADLTASQPPYITTRVK